MDKSRYACNKSGDLSLGLLSARLVPYDDAGSRNFEPR
jgi:hypothetical protein